MANPNDPSKKGQNPELYWTDPKAYALANGAGDMFADSTIDDLIEQKMYWSTDDGTQFKWIARSDADKNFFSETSVSDTLKEFNEYDSTVLESWINAPWYKQGKSKKYNGKGDEEQCITTPDSGGINHPYNGCVKDTDEMIKLPPCDKWGGRCMGAVTNGAINYLASTVIDAGSSISDKCNNLFGNQYVIKTNVKCNTDSGSCSEQPVHEYIDNVGSYNFITGRYEKKMGVIPASINSATKINPIGLIQSFYDETEPTCEKKHVKCNVVNSKDIEPDYVGMTSPLCFRKDASSKNMFKAKDGFANINEFINNNKSLIIQNNRFFDNDKNDIDYLNEIEKNINNINNIDLDLFNKFNHDILIKMYYLGFSLILIFIIFKIIHK